MTTNTQHVRKARSILSASPATLGRHVHAVTNARYIAHCCLMPWTCPGLSHERAAHYRFASRRPLYRCRSCRLHMTFDPVTKIMKPVPPNDDNGEKRRNAT